MDKNKKSIIIFGAGYFGRELIKALYENWNLIIVDIKEEKLKSLKSVYPEIESVVGDASSILTWKKINLENVFHIILTIKDTDVSLEACRILNEVFELEISTTVFLYNEEKGEKLKDCKNINIIKPASLVVNTVISLIEKNVKYATNIGLGNKEIVEVNILSRSHIVDRPLRYLRPSRWKVGAIYRNDTLILPSGKERIKVGDKVILMGEPKVLDNLVNILLKGIPQFPLQFGNHIVAPYSKKFKELTKELAYFVKDIKADKVFIFPYKSYTLTKEDETFLKSLFAEKLEIKSNVNSIKSLFKYPNNIAFVAIPYKNLSFFEKLSIKRIFEESDKPFLILNNKYPYEKVIAILNSEDPAYTLEVAVEISRMLKVDIQTIYTAMPKELRGEKENENLEMVNSIVSDFESIYKTSMNFELFEGNPVKKTLKFLKGIENPLLIMSYKRQKISFFNPHVQYLIMKKSGKSSLLIPIEDINE
ncbi:MAG: hypothetical protein DSY47_05380 [Hydrogenothermus sp.]|nr:MAG: hypothetical protein DSY47_05380 [Hydrogenothermus sp.]